jgi:hypothetical protein
MRRATSATFGLEQIKHKQIYLSHHHPHQHGQFSEPDPTLGCSFIVGAGGKPLAVLRGEVVKLSKCCTDVPFFCYEQTLEVPFIVVHCFTCNGD